MQERAAERGRARDAEQREGGRAAVGRQRTDRKDTWRLARAETPLSSSVVLYSTSSACPSVSTGSTSCCLKIAVGWSEIMASSPARLLRYASTAAWLLNVCSEGPPAFASGTDDEPPAVLCRPRPAALAAFFAAGFGRYAPPKLSMSPDSVTSGGLRGATMDAPDGAAGGCRNGGAAPPSDDLVERCDDDVLDRRIARSTDGSAAACDDDDERRYLRSVLVAVAAPLPPPVPCWLRDEERRRVGCGPSSLNVANDSAG